jgi:two-component system, chemotaxis family, response regulator WspF
MRVGIVNDLPGISELLRRIVDLTRKHHVIWVAGSGADALELCVKETPDLILMDLVMPGMNGAEATRRIMASTPCAILIVTVSMRDNAGLVLDALTHGAIDAVDIPTMSGGDLRNAAGPFLTKIDTMSRLIGEKPDAGNAGPRRPAPALLRHNRLIAIGASAGGPAVLSMILRGLPKEFPAAIVVVQHVGEQFASGMADWLGQDSALPVRVAEEGDQPTIGCVLLAGTSDHLTMKTADRLGYTADPSDYAYRPSVDVFFRSVCRLWLGDVVGVLLTGMGRDGAMGLKALRDCGHYTIAQDEATSPVYGMPKAAAALNAAVDILPAERIAPRLMEVLMCKT